MPTKQKTEQPAERDAEPETETVPDWVNETPDDTDYALVMWGTDGGCEQQLHISRGEFIRLKRWVAALRGYDLGAPLDSFTVSGLRNKPETEQEYEKIAITQEEIQMVMDVELVADVLCLNLRRRMKLDANVEPGKWRLDDDNGDSIETYEQGSVAGCGRCGLDIRVTPDAKAAGQTP